MNSGGVKSNAGFIILISSGVVINFDGANSNYVFWYFLVVGKWKKILESGLDV